MGQNSIYFRPTNQVFQNQQQFEEAHASFYHGALTEEFAQFCVHDAIHAFWLNYETRGKKCDKETFSLKVKELINQMLKDI